MAVVLVFTKHIVSLKKKFASEDHEKYRSRRVQKLKAILLNPELVFGDHIEIDES